MVVLGGLGSFPGALVGGLLLGIMESFGNFYGSSRLAMLVMFVALILILLVRPSGIMGAKE